MSNNSIIAEIKKDEVGKVKNEKHVSKNAYEVIESIQCKKDNSITNEIIRKIKENTRR